MYTGTTRNVYCIDNNGLSLLGEAACGPFIASRDSTNSAAMQMWLEIN